MNVECADPSKKKRGFDFVAMTGKCPKCGASLDDRDSRHLILKLTVIHLNPLTKWGKGHRGERGGVIAACTGRPVAGTQATGAPNCVTCAACKATPLWRELADKFGYEVITEISPERAEELRQAAAQTLKRRNERMGRG
jgi:hypothetical protein